MQKCTTAIRQLAYAGPADMFGEYLHMGETTSLEVLWQFCRRIRAIFGTEYLQTPTAADCQILLDMDGRVHSFPRMMDNIDCMHWNGGTTRWLGKGSSLLGTKAHTRR